MTRAEHLDWCKKRALEYTDAGDVKNAVSSMLSDLSKHPETADHVGGALGVTLILGGFLSDPYRVVEWIKGFN
jgi:hypothetical protein